MSKGSRHRHWDDQSTEVMRQLDDELRGFLYERTLPHHPPWDPPFTAELGPNDQSGLAIIVVSIGFWAMGVREEMEPHFAEFQGRAIQFDYDDRYVQTQLWGFFWEHVRAFQGRQAAGLLPGVLGRSIRILRYKISQRLPWNTIRPTTVLDRLDDPDSFDD
jgi:hypothetical protein